MTATLNGNTLTITIDIDPNGPLSSTGKTQIAGSSRGYYNVPDSPYSISLNVLKKR